MLLSTMALLFTSLLPLTRVALALTIAVYPSYAIFLVNVHHVLAVCLVASAYGNTADVDALSWLLPYSVCELLATDLLFSGLTRADAIST
ncbi:hypothetical protein EV363DRAFT_1373057 [Boletus edulis]|uniref:Uncharacterized protein n=1 Tax=Boletus edulis BED1 TaxID=1328754 RepID=A0AAD4BCG5_BOLED|nr:hypothetical protein EV363DRAFT_1373057 [Boletus edulis]KAF8417611.1 hypothetical protein L210DRAFT_3580692 [Boletus edulis BED1]KAF8425359.1 hypothetical protein L210DRAFT_3567531 [Boletus edulis BED1]